MMVDNRVEKKTVHGDESGRRSHPLIKRGDKGFARRSLLCPLSYSRHCNGRLVGFEPTTWGVIGM